MKGMKRELSPQKCKYSSLIINYEEKNNSDNKYNFYNNFMCYWNKKI